MSEMTISKCLITNSMPPYVVTEYYDPTGVAKSTGYPAVLDLVLRAPYIDREKGEMTSNGLCYGIQLISLAVSSETSTNFDLRIFNKYNVAPAYYQNTIYEVVKYAGINISKLDTNLGELVILNRDEPNMNYKLYFHIINYDAGHDTGAISLCLTYKTVQLSPISL